MVSCSEHGFLITIIVAGSLILGLILFLCSYSIVDISEYGIVYDKNK